MHHAYNQIVMRNILEKVKINAKRVLPLLKSVIK